MFVPRHTLSNSNRCISARPPVLVDSSILFIIATSNVVALCWIFKLLLNISLVILMTASLDLCILVAAFGPDDNLPQAILASSGRVGSFVVHYTD